MKAELLHRFRDITEDGHIIEMVVWRVPNSVPPSKHGLKYRFAYIVNGKRVVGFDNERGKGDHCHLDGQEYTYDFQSLERLIDDFIREVEQRRAR
jgi:hypothetical protein